MVVDSKSRITKEEHRIRKEKARNICVGVNTVVLTCGTACCPSMFSFRVEFGEAMLLL